PVEPSTTASGAAVTSAAGAGAAGAVGVSAAGGASGASPAAAKSAASAATMVAPMVIAPSPAASSSEIVQHEARPGRRHLHVHRVDGHGAVALHRQHVLHHDLRRALEPAEALDLGELRHAQHLAAGRVV